MAGGGDAKKPSQLPVVGQRGWQWLRRGGGYGGLLSQWLSQRGGCAVHEPIGGGARSSLYPQEVDALGETLEGEFGAAGVGGWCLADHCATHAVEPYGSEPLGAHRKLTGAEAHRGRRGWGVVYGCGGAAIDGEDAALALEVVSRRLGRGQRYIVAVGLAGDIDAIGVAVGKGLVALTQPVAEERHIKR